MSQNWALAFAPQKSYLVGWNGTGKAEQYEFSLSGSDGKFLLPDQMEVKGTPLFELLAKGDTLYAEMGGKNGPFLLQALEHGLNIKQIPSFLLSKDQLPAVAAPVKEEEDETTEERMVRFQRQSEQNRKARAQLIMILAKSQPELFYQMLPIDPPVWRINAYISAYISIQRDARIKAQQRNLLYQTDFAWLPDSTDRKPLNSIREMLADPADIEYNLALEAQLLAAISKELPKVKIWTHFLEEIPGIGPSLAGRLVAGIGNMRRFPKRGGFRAYCGYAVVMAVRNGVEVGRMQRFYRHKEGEDASANGPKFDPEMRQALYLVGEQIVRQGEKNPYNKIYVAEKKKYLEDGSGRSQIHCHRMAIRKAVSFFLEDLWAAWWRIIEDEGEALPDSVSQVLYPVDPHRNQPGYTPTPEKYPRPRRRF